MLNYTTIHFARIEDAMKFDIKPNGNLVLTLEPGDREALADDYNDHGADDSRFLVDILEHTGWEGNGRLYSVQPEDVGALTEAPILADNKQIADDGTVTVPGNVWWFPDYMVTSFAKKLMTDGSVTFTAAPENEQPRPASPKN